MAIRLKLTVQLCSQEIIRSCPEKCCQCIEPGGRIAENGFPQGAILIKVEAKKREQEQLERLIASIQRNVLAQSQTREQESSVSSVGAQSDLEFLQGVLEKEAVGRVVIDLPAILAGNSDADIQLEAGINYSFPNLATRFL